MKVGLNILTKRYDDGTWIEGMILKFENGEAVINTPQGTQRVIKVSDIAYIIDRIKIKDGKKEYDLTPVEEYSEHKKKGKKLKPDGTQLPDDYGTPAYFERIKKESE